MSHFYKFGLLVCAVLISTSDGVPGRYRFEPASNGWVTLHKVAATWEDALQQCQREDAVLMSPIQGELRDTMRSLNEDNFSYFIGTKATGDPNLFISVEGVPLHDMPVTDMFPQLDPQDGACLSMDRDHIHVASCAARLPYMCYKEKKADQDVTECGTLDEGYILKNSTGSCYKFHSVFKTWEQAYSTCVAEGGYLAVVNNAMEALEMVQVSHLKTHYVTIGSRYWKEIGGWRSVHDDRLQQIYNVWEQVLPADSCCQICTIDPVTGILKPFGDDRKGPFICEKDPNYIRFFPKQ